MSVSYLILRCVTSLMVPIMQKAHVVAASSFAQTQALDFLHLLQRTSSFDTKWTLGMLISRWLFWCQRKFSILSSSSHTTWRVSFWFGHNIYFSLVFLHEVGKTIKVRKFRTVP